MNNEETDNCSQPSACEKSTPIASSSVRARKTIKKTTTMQCKKNKCSVCKKVMLGGSLKRHMIRKHSTKLNDNQVKRIVWDAQPCKDYHKNVSCSVCGKAFRGDYLKKTYQSNAWRRFKHCRCNKKAIILKWKDELQLLRSKSDVFNDVCHEIKD